MGTVRATQEIPLPVRGKALTFGAEEWLEELPWLISRLERSPGTVSGWPIPTACLPNPSTTWGS